MQKLNKKAKSQKAKSVAVAYSSKINLPAPKIVRQPKVNDGRITITNREMISPIVILTDYGQAKSITINPGLASSFPWLSTIANNFETYRFEKLKYTYVPACPTSTIGSVMMAIDYDVLDAFPVNQMYFMGTHGAVLGSTWEHIECIGEKDSLKKFNERYTRKGTRSVNDPKTYDVGNLFVATMAGGATIQGNLFVDYTVTLMSPQLRSDAFDSCLKVTNTTGTGAATPFGTVANAIATGGLEGAVSDSDKITFNNVGEYLLGYEAIGTGLTGAASTISLFTGSGSVSALSYLANTAQTAADYLYRVKVDSPGTAIRLSNIPATTITSMVARLGSYAYSLA